MVRAKQSSEDVARAWANVLFYFFIGVGSMMAWYVATLFWERPWYSLSLSVVVVMLCDYLKRPDSGWHKSQQQENQFWMLVSFMGSSALVFAPDSPYALSGKAGWFIVAMCTSAAHVLDNRHHRSRLLRRLDNAPLDHLDHSTAGDKIREVQELVRLLDGNIPSTLQTMWNIGSYVDVERKILDHFCSASKEELNAIMLRCEMKLVAYKLKNHNRKSKSNLDLAMAVYKRQNRYRSALMDVLAVRRVSDLCLPARAIVLDMIQGLRMTLHPDTQIEAQQWIANLLLTVRGDELSDLKQLVDNKGSAESMHKLLYQDIVSESLRNRILEHFRQQASFQAAVKKMGSTLAKKRMLKGAWRKILSDVDDTLFSSGGRFPAGMDTTYKHKVVYPGITTLYKELDLGTVGPAAKSGVWPASRFGDLVFLSARPHVYKDVTETTMFVKFRGFIKNQSLHCMPSLLPGDLESGQAFMMKADFGPMALKKFKNFVEYHSLYPEFTHVFIGDNGQADVKAAELMVERFGRQVVERVYIHQVIPIQHTYGYEPGVSEEKWRKYGIIFCTTYIDAAIDAATRPDGESKPLILLEGMRRVTLAAAADFEKVKMTWSNPYHRDVRRMELNHDISRANKRLIQHSLPPVELIKGSIIHPIGSIVHSGWGKGVVTRYCPKTGMYEVYLTRHAGARHPTKLYALVHSLFTSERVLRHERQKHKAEKEFDDLATPKPRTTSVDTESSLTMNAAINSGGGAAVPNSNMSTASSVASSYKGSAHEPRKQTDPIDVYEASARKIKTRFEFSLMSTAQTFYGSQARGPLLRRRSSTGEHSATARSLQQRRMSTSPARGSSDTNAAQKLGHEPFETKLADFDDTLEIGTFVHTPYGQGIVLCFREHDNIYELLLPKSSMFLFVWEVRLVQWNKKLFQDRLDAMMEGGSYHFRLFDLLKNIFVRPSDHSKKPSLEMPVLEEAFTPLKEGTIVNTVYGSGSIVSYRPYLNTSVSSEALGDSGTPSSKAQDNNELECGTYVVALNWGAEAYLTADQVTVDSAYQPLSLEESEKLLKSESSPIQAARKAFWSRMSAIPNPFFTLRSSRDRVQGKSSSNVLAPSDSYVSLCSLASAPSTVSSTGFYSVPEEQRISDLWNLKPEDPVSINGFGTGILLKARDDGFFEVQFPYGVGYFSVPRPFSSATMGGKPFATGTRTFTAYGVGIVESFREEDSIYCIRMEKWRARVYLRATAPTVSQNGMVPVNKSRSLSQDVSEAHSQLEGSEKVGFKSSFLSFISNIIPGARADTEEGTLCEEPSPELPPVAVGHTYFTWGSGSMNEVPLVVPPGHTAFSWAGGPKLDEKHFGKLAGHRVS